MDLDLEVPVLQFEGGVRTILPDQENEAARKAWEQIATGSLCAVRLVYQDAAKKLWVIGDAKVLDQPLPLKYDAKATDMASMRTNAYCLYHGVGGVDKADRKAATDIFEKAVTVLKVEDGQWYLDYARCMDAEGKRNLAIEYCDMAAYRGHAEAAFILFFIYWRGLTESTNTNWKEAQRYLLRADDLGHPMAPIYMALFYLICWFHPEGYLHDFQPGRDRIITEHLHRYSTLARVPHEVAIDQLTKMERHLVHSLHHGFKPFSWPGIPDFRTANQLFVEHLREVANKGKDPGSTLPVFLDADSISCLLRWRDSHFWPAPCRRYAGSGTHVNPVVAWKRFAAWEWALDNKLVEDTKRAEDLVYPYYDHIYLTHTHVPQFRALLHIVKMAEKRGMVSKDFVQFADTQDKTVTGYCGFMERLHVHVPYWLHLDTMTGEPLAMRWMMEEAHPHRLPRFIRFMDAIGCNYQDWNSHLARADSSYRKQPPLTDKFDALKTGAKAAQLRELFTKTIAWHTEYRKECLADKHCCLDEKFWTKQDVSCSETLRAWRLAEIEEDEASVSFLHFDYAFQPTAERVAAVCNQCINHDPRTYLY